MITALLHGLAKRQLSPLAPAAATLAPSPDGFGGIPMTGQAANEPEWSSASMLCGSAVALRAGAMLGAEQRPPWILHLALGMRFIRQLSMQGSSLYCARNPAEADGGVRQAIWHNHMPLDATAMSLLAAVEFQHGLAAPPESK
jgi:hypothetical protein